LLWKSKELLPKATDDLDVFAVVPDEKDLPKAFSLVNKLREAGVSADLDSMGRSFKAQMKQANRLAAKKVIILGADELSRGAVVLKNMADSKQEEVAMDKLLTAIQEEK